MRTTNKVQKTENKPIKKTISKMFAIIVSLILISFTVSAQGFWKQILVNNTYGKMAELMVEQKNAEDQLLKSNSHFPETTVTIPVINNGTAMQMTFKSYFGSQWDASQNIIKTHVPLVDWKFDESNQSN
jgi:hypothetical protein